MTGCVRTGLAEARRALAAQEAPASETDATGGDRRRGAPRSGLEIDVVVDAPAPAASAAAAGTSEAAGGGGVVGEGDGGGGEQATHQLIDAQAEIDVLRSSLGLP